MMHLEGLKQATKKLAKGEYHCVDHRITEYHTGEVRHDWRAYTEQASWTTGHSTPEGALLELERLHRNLK